MDEAGGEALKFFQTLAEGGQTWSHRVRMVKQVIKTALGLASLCACTYLAYAASRIDPMLLQSGYYCLKVELAPYLYPQGVPVSGKFWQKISNENTTTQERVIPINALLSCSVLVGDFLPKLTRYRHTLWIEVGSELYL